MKQEKKQTASFNIEARPVSFDIETRLQPWQEQALDALMTKAGTPMVILGCGRGTGKSHMAAMYMAGMSGMGGTAVFGSPWDEWEDTFVWPWNPKKSIESGKRIWGRVMVRYNSVVWEANGKQKQYATKKEVFQRKLRGED